MNYFMRNVFNFFLEVVLPIFTVIITLTIGICTILWFAFYMQYTVYPQSDKNCQSSVIERKQ